MADVEIWHNPACSKSRKALEIVREAGHRVHVVAYLEAPPTAERLREVLALLGVGPRELMRTGEAIYAELGLGDPALTADALVAAMVAHPVLIERPVVVTTRGAVIARPPERAHDVL